MKQLKLAMLAMFALLTVGNVSAQDENNPWAVGFGINTVDPRNQTSEIGTWAKDYLGTGEWGSNTIPSISRGTLSRYLDKGFSLQLAGSLNKIKTLRAIDDIDALYISLELMANYDLNNLIGDTKWFDPYLGLGGGYHHFSKVGKGGILTGQWGFNIWFNDNLGMNFNSAYKQDFGGKTDLFQHGLGLVFRFGGKDTDGDGVYDKDDECPETPGLKEFKGCPDTDGDGIPDKDDACPEVAGLAEFNGCPDTDGDGIPNNLDKCPEVAGPKKFNGCPDTDGDGIPDNLDKCPKIKGPKENNGCPWPDTDGDGIPDHLDKCPKVPGIAELNGCPKPKRVISEKAEKEIGDFARAIYFNSGRASFRPGVTEKLYRISEIMKQFSKASFSIEGHTDSQGARANNQRLSERRARAVLDYLVRNGISANRLTSQGLGEDYPIDTNKTRAGRSNNRRVEIKLKK